MLNLSWTCKERKVILILKINDYSTTHQLTWGKILIILNAHKNAEKLDQSHIPGENANGAITLKKSLAVSYTYHTT